VLNLIVIDNTNAKEYEMPVEKLKVHPSFIKSDDSIPEYAVAVGFAKLEKAQPAIHNLDDFVDDIIDESIDFLADFDPMNGENLQICWYPPDNAIEMMEDLTKITEVVPGSDGYKTIRIQKMFSTQRQSGCPVIKMKKDNSFDIVGMILWGEAEEWVCVAFTPKMLEWVQKTGNL